MSAERPPPLIQSVLEDTPPEQQRPSVLRHVSQRGSKQAAASGWTCKRERMEAAPPPRSSSSQTRLLHPPMKRESSCDDDEGGPGGTSSLFVNGACRWPGCEQLSEDLTSFLKHLHCEHGHDARSLAQWRVQQDMVHYMETQLLHEKQKLQAMQLHLSEHRPAHMTPVTDGNTNHWSSTQDMKVHEDSSRVPPYTTVLPALVSNMDCYQHHNIRPPFTYAHLIRWSILESPDKQRSLSEIYTWFSSKFFYFRHNSATWKNAVRHNLSLHKCFVRVEGGRGAAWIVDEAEYQKRRSQKFHRDCPVKWFSPYCH